MGENNEGSPKGSTNPEQLGQTPLPNNGNQPGGTTNMPRGEQSGTAEGSSKVGDLRRDDADEKSE